MKKKSLWLISLAASFLLTQVSPSMLLQAAEDMGYEEEYENTEEETESPFPDSYYLPVESNEIDGWPAGPIIEAEAAVVMDASTGAFLYSKNMDAKEYPASTTKIMTALVALEHADLKEKVTFSDYAVFSLEEGSSHVGLQPGEVLRMNRALYGLMLESGNDAANGIAEHVGGSIEGFSEMMNQKAAELGCVNTHFTNPHGLHNEDHYTCARDLALITRAAIQNEAFRKIAGTTYYECPKTNKVKEIRYWKNHNQMIQPDAEYYYEGCLGGKTGFTNDALNTLVTYAERDGRTLICVELRVNGAYKAYSESQQMLDYAFENFQNVEISVDSFDKTEAELLGMGYLGELAELQPDLQQKAVTIEGAKLVTLPKGADISDVQMTGQGNGKIGLTYHGWDVGGFSLKAAPLDYAVFVPKTVEVKVDEASREREPGLGGMVQVAVRETKEVGKSAGRFFKQIPEKFPDWIETAREAGKSAADWVNEHDIFMALVGLVLLLILLPVLLITWGRNARIQKIRRQRKKEREERIRREEFIDQKSVSEIEEELRAELQKDWEERQRAVKEESQIQEEGGKEPESKENASENFADAVEEWLNTKETETVQTQEEKGNET